MNRLIQWFVENPIAANLLMAVIALGGLSNLASLNKEVFPGAEVGMVRVEMAYPGAGPKEVEEQIVKRVEEAIADLDGIEQITSTARQSMGIISVESVNDYDMQRLLNNVKARIDAISTFPVDAERATVTEVLWQSEIMSIAIYGHAGEAVLKRTGEQVRDEMALLPGISTVELKATRPDEMSIEVSEQALQRYNLSFEQVANTVRQSSLNLPAGTIRTTSGDIQLQTRGQAYSAEDFRLVVIDSREDGAQRLLGDIATITDGFAEQDIVARFNGQPAVFLEVLSSEQPDVLESAAIIQQYIADNEHLLPDGVHMTVWSDWSYLFEGRMNLLLKNSISGLCLVFLVLMLFLRPALAAWVSVGIAVSFLGTLWLLPYFGVSLNMISMFAFLLVLGIVVDDAIIVGESIYTSQQHGIQGNAAAASGAKMVAKPVLFAVISTMLFFAPLLVTPGAMGDMSYAIPVVVILSLFFSLIESLLILPAHLAHLKPEKPSKGSGLFHRLAVMRTRLAEGLEHFANRHYAPRLKVLLKQNGSTLAGFTVAVALSVAVYNGGWLVRTFMPIVPSDFIQATITMPEGSSAQLMGATLKQVEEAVSALKQDKTLNGGKDIIRDLQSWSYGNTVEVSLSLADGKNRNLSADDITEHWRDLIGPIPSAEEIKLNYTINDISEDIRLRLSVGNDDAAALQGAADAVINQLSRYPGVYDIRNSLTAERTEIELDLKPHAETLDLSLQDIARQVRQGFYGEEVQRIPRGREDVKVMVRYSEAERTQIEHLSDMRIRTNDGREIPLEAVADITFVPGYTKIERVDRKRAIIISAEVEEGVSDSASLLADLRQRNTAAWKQAFPGFDLVVDGDMRDEAEFLASALRHFALVMLIVYGLMAVAFRSYWQPFLVLTAIPFGFMGAVIGHLIMGREVSMMSMLGFFACAGVVVNDNLVLLDRINQLRKQGLEVFDAVVQAGRDRFRPIVLTSLTTFIGLMPIMAETSTQALFLIPMVISLSFGVLFATAVTLILVPAMYLSGEQLRAALSKTKEPLTEAGGA